MVQTLTGALAWLIHPSARRRPDAPFRYSHAFNEVGTYQTDFGTTWQPPVLEGDPPIKYTLPERKSRKFYDSFVPLIPERAALARQVLLDWGAIKPDFALIEYYDWKLVESAVARKAEFANGADVFAKDAWPRLRPQFYAFMLDVCCLAHVSALKANPDAKTLFQNDLPSMETINPTCFPMIAIGSRMLGSTFSRTWQGCVIPTDPEERTPHFSRFFELLHRPYHAPTPEEEEAELHAWLDDIVADTGQLPDENEFIAMMTDSKITFDEVPRSVWERLGIET